MVYGVVELVGADIQQLEVAGIEIHPDGVVVPTVLQFLEIVLELVKRGLFVEGEVKA